MAAALFTLAALLLAPPALADNECELVGVDPSVNGPLADSYDCDQASYPDGVTYTADGDLTVDFTATPTSNIGGGGISLDALGSDSIFFDSATTATELDSDGVAAALLGVTTVNGDIDIAVEEMDADFAPTTHGIFAESTGTGSIDINTTGNVDTASNSNPASSVGIEALTDSGAIVVTAEGRVDANEGGIRAVSSSGDITVTGNSMTLNDGVYGIQAISGGGNVDVTATGSIFAGEDGIGIDAQTSGSGTLDITAAASVSRVEATTGTGLMTINVAGGGISGRSVAGILANAGGNMLIDVSDGSVTSGSATQGLGMDLTAVGGITINNAGRIDGGQGDGAFAIRAAGDTLVINNNGQIGASVFFVRGGAIDLTGLENGYTFNNNGTWGVATDRSNPQRLSILGAGTFNNAGTIIFGEQESVIQAHGTTFNGLPGSLLDMTMTLSKVGQTDCSAPVAAGCLDLSGGTTTGQTGIRISSAAPPLDPAGGLTPEPNAEGILLVDVSGGTSAAEHFVIDAGSENFADTALYGGVVTTGGPLVYALLYNPDTQQHVLSTVPSDEGVTYAAFNQEVLSIWHLSADAVTGRQADLREGAAKGGWIRVVHDSSERESRPTLTTQGNTFVYQQDYDLDTSAVLFGVDAHTGENHVIGLHSGLLRSDLEFADSTNRDRIKGAAVGVYGGWWQDLGLGQLTLDATVNANFLRLQHKNNLDNTDTDVRTVGVRAEAGWRLPLLGEAFFVQPLATAAYARANFEKLSFSQNSLRFEEANSERVALGLRLGGDPDLGDRSRLRYWLTARAWEENNEDGSVDYQTTGDPLSIKDDFSESFEEVGLGASLTNADDTLSLFVSGNVQSGDQTDSANVTVGARMRW